MINTTINQFLTKQLPNLKIAVVGDVMVDRYVFGDVSRISVQLLVMMTMVAYCNIYLMPTKLIQLV